MAYDDNILKDSTSVILEVMVRDSTTGLGKTGLTHSDMSVYYTRAGAAAVAITLSSTGSGGDAYSSGKWAEVSNTNAKGLYQLHVPNAGAFATGVDSVTFNLQAAGMIDKQMRYALVDVDLRDSVRMGMTALPNAAADEAGGLATSAGGATGIDDLATAAALTTVDTEVGQIKTRVETALPDAEPGDTDGLHILGENRNGAEYLGIVVFESGIEGDISGTIQGSVTGNVGGIAGTINTLDQLDTQQDSQHLATQSAVATADGKLDTLLTRITSTLFSGITSMAEWLGLLAGKQVGDSTARTEIRATGAGSGTFNETDHSLEAIRERGDIGWTTGAGGSAPTEAEMYTYFTSASRENAFKATGFSTFDPTIDTVALGKILTTAITESNTGDVAESFSFFFDVDPVTTKTVNDVGVSGTGLTEQNVRDAMKLAPTAGPAATGSIDSDLELLQTATDAVKAKTDQFRFTVANQVDANALTGGGGDDAATIYTYFTSSNRQGTFRATGYSTHSAADVYAAMGNGSNLTDASSGVTTDLTTVLFGTSYRAFRLVDTKQAIGDCQLVLQGLSNIEAINSQTEFEIQLGSTDDDAYNNCLCVILDETNATQKSVRKITDYVGATKTVTIESAPDFTIEEGDSIVILPALSTANAGNVTVGSMTQAALAQFLTDDTGETVAADGSVAKIAQGQAGGNVTVGSMTKAALAQFATDDTEETTVADGSVAKLSQGSGSGSNLGSGSNPVTILLTDTNDDPVPNAKVWVSVDNPYTTPGIRAGTVTTDDFGKTPELMLDVGTYYVWAKASTHNITNPQTLTVT
jgi:uncharacterized protein YaiE (UPF0345 family)